jgi:hypothetical protein
MAPETPFQCKARAPGTYRVDGFLVRKTRWMCVSSASGRQDFKIEIWNQFSPFYIPLTKYSVIFLYMTSMLKRGSKIEIHSQKLIKV